MIRVLVAEDSPTARALLVQVLGEAPGVLVVGEAKDGVEAVEMARRLRPDLITMDVFMPRLDGLAAAREVMADAPTPILIVTAGPSGADVSASMEVLRSGALDVLAKPSDPASPGFEAEARRLVAAVKAMSQVKVVRHWRPASPASLASPDRPPPAPAALPPKVSATASRPGRGGPIRVVAVAASTGGPVALQRVLAGLPADYPRPILVVQHITAGFGAGLASWLDGACRLRVKSAAHGDRLEPATAYLAPDGVHLGVTASGVVELSAGPPLGGFRPSATHLFESVARAYGPAALAVVLTGMGDDGVAGLFALRRAGGTVVAQDEATSVVFGMPGATVAAGLAHAVLALDAMAPYLVAVP